MTEIFSELTKDAALQAFLNSNLQPIDGNNEIGGYRWKYHVDAMVEGIVNILSFSSEDMLYHGPTVVLKAGKSDFVRTKHVDTIKTLFPNYRLVTVRDSGHWLHAEFPEEFHNEVEQYNQNAKKIDYFVGVNKNNFMVWFSHDLGVCSEVNTKKDNDIGIEIHPTDINDDTSVDSLFQFISNNTSNLNSTNTIIL